jgi:hypothetical protein
MDKPPAYLVLDGKQGKVYIPGEDCGPRREEAGQPVGTWRVV